jgi:hypothetical protein
MSRKQLLEEISRLPLHERIALLEQILHSLRKEIASTDEEDLFDPLAIDRLHGALRGDGSALTDQEVDRIRFDYLMEKHK